jgi:hypothetical protein
MTSVTTERGFSLDKMRGLISTQRLKPYLDQSGGAPAEALELYEWSARMAGAAFETLAQLEVIMRNAIDSELSIYYDEAECGIPWFLLRGGDTEVPEPPRPSRFDAEGRYSV